jgi:hypothetical protein
MVVLWVGWSLPVACSCGNDFSLQVVCPLLAVSWDVNPVDYEVVVPLLSLLFHSFHSFNEFVHVLFHLLWVLGSTIF